MYDGRGMDSAPASGSVRKAREMAQGGYPRQQPLYPDNMDDSPPGELRAPPRRPMGGQPSAQSRLPKPKAAPAIDYRSGSPASSTMASTRPSDGRYEFARPRTISTTTRSTDSGPSTTTQTQPSSFFAGSVSTPRTDPSVSHTRV
ncbi:hypothetical protein LB505_006985 [Fusarium chuoi]|nr:hypothetical protein LB505_006985 [Fusarium chuoi]